MEIIKLKNTVGARGLREAQRTDVLDFQITRLAATWLAGGHRDKGKPQRKQGPCGCCRATGQGAHRLHREQAWLKEGDREHLQPPRVSPRAKIPLASHLDGSDAEEFQK